MGVAVKVVPETEERKLAFTKIECDIHARCGIQGGLGKDFGIPLAFHDISQRMHLENRKKMERVALVWYHLNHTRTWRTLGAKDYPKIGRNGSESNQSKFL